MTRAEIEKALEEELALARKQFEADQIKDRSRQFERALKRYADFFVHGKIPPEFQSTKKDAS